MKKVTMNTILSLISSIDTAEAEQVRAELNAELNKGAAKAEANRALYDAAKEVVIGALSETPVTAAELFDEVKDNLPEGFTKAKVQYALTHYWEADVTKIEGSPNTYAAKA